MDCFLRLAGDTQLSSRTPHAGIRPCNGCTDCWSAGLDYARLRAPDLCRLDDSRFPDRLAGFAADDGGDVLRDSDSGGVDFSDPRP